MVTKMTNIQESIDMNTATQVDIADVLPNPIDAVKDAVKELAKGYATISKAQTATNELRAEIADIRLAIAEAASEADDDRLQELTKALRQANNRLDKAIEKHTDTEYSLDNLKEAVVTAVGAL
jgi:chromosome segregation ATPase